MRTTLTLDDDIAAKLADLAKKSGRPFKVIVNETLRQGLNAKRAQKPRDRFVVKPRELGLRAGVTYDNVGELLDEIENRP